MEQYFLRKANIPTMRHAVPIRFAHSKTLDNPSNHVLHINNYVEIYFFIKGKHKYIVENSLYELSRGDIIIINPLEVHKALPLCETEYERFYFLVDTHALDAMANAPLRAILEKPTGKENLLALPEGAREDVITKLYQISACFDGKQEELRAFGLFLEILHEISRGMGKSKMDAPIPSSAPTLLENILSYIAENLTSLQSVSDIATHLGVTPQYLSVYFSKHIGTPLKTYVQARKIALAKDLLDKGADVTEACFGCGFNECSYFIRVFKKYVGVTPLHYKSDQNKK